MAETIESIIDTYQHKVFRLCCAMLNDRALAEETAQEVFVRVWKALPGYRGDASLSTWIYAIARNECLSALKAGKRGRGLSLEFPAVRAAAERASSGGPAAPDRTPDIERLMQSLPDSYRQVVMLFHMEEKSYEQVAAMLDLPLGTVKTNLHRARKQMAEALRAARETTIVGGK